MSEFEGSPDWKPARLSIVEATITDLDGVIRNFPESRDRAIEGRYGLPDGALSQVAFFSSPIQQALIGAISDGAWREAVQSRLKALFPDVDVESAVRDWTRFAGVVDFEVLNEIKRLKKLGPILLMANATNRLDADLAELEIRRSFDQILSSSSVGYSKPGFEIFRLALQQLNIPAEKILFIDDSPENVRTARGLGFQTHRFRNLAELRREVRERLDPFGLNPGAE